ncbi:hypothetical protein BDY17DRAFT_294084 [Neohortaea acidophila]|uniref:Uncharacterized protein n=1 Tax=Neohortaea acidophila TaxID=245834 RepID=A0A6A6Q2N9_9PEZI|nr:uncharacterized protein BDY17DRAFT_294084 [Neohortaea acidophila]KAF2485687.1 hypothetical protein BDY17DRAFT_294084 [Neohortaea acidophila]
MDTVAASLATQTQDMLKEYARMEMQVEVARAKSETLRTRVTNLHNKLQSERDRSQGQSGRVRELMKELEEERKHSRRLEGHIAQQAQQLQQIGWIVNHQPQTTDGIPEMSKDVSKEMTISHCILSKSPPDGEDMASVLKDTPMADEDEFTERPRLIVRLRHPSFHYAS